MKLPDDCGKGKIDKKTYLAYYARNTKNEKLTLINKAEGYALMKNL